MTTRTPLPSPPTDRAAPELDRRVAARPIPALPRRAPEQPRWRLSPGQRKALLAAHIVVSVGLLGLSTALFVLATAATVASDAATTQAAYRAMGVVTRGVVPAVAISALATGVVLSLGTRWGLFRYAWIVVKLGFTVATIVSGMLILSPMLRGAIAATSGAMGGGASELGAAPLLLVATTAANVLMLGAATVISVYKPWGPLGRHASDARSGPRASGRSKPIS